MPKPSRNQRRRKKLAERHNRRRRLVPPPQRYTNEQIADAVHHAVCAHTGSDGFGHCRLYAVAGWVLLQRLGYRNVVPQAGRLSLMPDPADPTLWLDMDPAFGLLGEIHCWLVIPPGKPAPGQHEMSGDMQVVDFAARHYRSYAERLPSIHSADDGSFPITGWLQEEPPVVLWTAWANLPPWVRVSAQEKPTNRLLRSLDVGEGRLLLRAAVAFLGEHGDKDNNQQTKRLT